MKIVSFPCIANIIYIYHKNCGWIPRKPYNVYEDLNQAVAQVEPKKIVNYTSDGQTIILNENHKNQ